MALYTSRKISWLLNGDATDSDSGYDGTGSGLSYVSGKIRDCGSFDGSNDYVSLPEISIFNGEGDFTFGFWVNADSWAAGQYLFDYGDGTNRISIYTVDVSGTVYLRFAVANATTTRTVSFSVATLSTGTWYYIAAFRHSNNNLFICSNYNALYGSATGQAFPTFSSPTGCLGANYDHSGGWFDGKIEQFCYWDARLTQYPDVYNLYAAGSGLDWPFGGILTGTFESTGTLAGDYIITAMKTGTFQSTGTLSGSGKQADLGHFWVTVSHDDGGEYNTAGIAKITENGYKVLEILWSEIDADYDHYNPHEIAVDNAGYLYVIGMDVWGKAIHKIDPASPGTPLWTYNVPSGTVDRLVVDPAGTYVYLASELTTARLTKLNASTGAEITADAWPLTYAEITTDCNTLIYGRDGYIYISDATPAATILLPYGIIQKIDPGDGSVEWTWMVDDEDDTNLFGMAVNANGRVIAMHDGAPTSETFTIIGSDGVELDRWSDVRNGGWIGLDDDDFAIIAGDDYTLTRADTDALSMSAGTDWDLSDLHNMGKIVLFPDDSKFFCGSLLRDMTDGSVIWAADADFIEWDTVYMPGTLPIRSAWFVTLTNGANGDVFTNLGVALSDGNFAVANGDDLVITVTPDAGYLVHTVEVNGEAV